MRVQGTDLLFVSSVSVKESDRNCDGIIGKVFCKK